MTLNSKNIEIVNAILREKCFYEDITSELMLKQDLGIDSLNLVEVIVGFEETFCIEFEENDLDPANLQTVGQLYELIDRYTGV